MDTNAHPMTRTSLNVLLEAWTKSNRERALRLVRPTNPHPTDTDLAARVESGLKHDGDNDPTRTPRGKRAVRKQGEKNAENADEFRKAELARRGLSESLLPRLEARLNAIRTRRHAGGAGEHASGDALQADTAQD